MGIMNRYNKEKQARWKIKSTTSVILLNTNGLKTPIKMQ